ncbi:MAG: hypothetical protein ACRC0L_12965 [Angustibacter sp.]
MPELNQPDPRKPSGTSDDNLFCQPERPEVFRWSAGLMCAGAIFSLLTILLVHLAISESPNALLDLPEGTSSEGIEEAQEQVLGGHLWIFGVTAVLWLCTAFFAYRGRLAPRTFGGFCLTVNSLALAYGFVNPGPYLGSMLHLISVLLGVAAVVLLWTPAARTYYQEYIQGVPW